MELNAFLTLRVVNYRRTLRVTIGDGMGEVAKAEAAGKEKVEVDKLRAKYAPLAHAIRAHGK
ncbi:hypothetical protein HK101_007065 [Irineochytrium annulatum]|nr:hypothetical protein HK101_007065 [Irineochytrium annulatum]